EIAPGIAKTEFSLVRYKGDEQKSNAVYDGTSYLEADDIAKIVLDCINLPKHVNINSLEVMPTTQSWAGFFFEKE
ncbi:MAG: NAD(P)-dependent oxidoreductase, partial [Campylobacter sp.]|nr:NAD(P)-dependent oxidoreductase [Campylobacter sp.]